MLCLFRALIVYAALVSLFAACPQSSAPKLASAPNALPKNGFSSEKNITRTEARDRGRDPVLDENYEAQLFAPFAAAPAREPQAVGALDTRLSA